MKNLKDEIEMHAPVVKTMEEMGYGLLTDGETFYRRGHEIKPREGITFTMRQAYEIHRLTTSLIEQEKERAVREFLEWYGRTYPDGVWRSDEVVIGEYLAERKG